MRSTLKVTLFSSMICFGSALPAIAAEPRPVYSCTWETFKIQFTNIKPALALLAHVKDPAVADDFYGPADGLASHLFSISALVGYLAAEIEDPEQLIKILSYREDLKKMVELSAEVLELSIKADALLARTRRARTVEEMLGYLASYNEIFGRINALVTELGRLISSFQTDDAKILGEYASRFEPDRFISFRLRELRESLAPINEVLEILTRSCQARLTEESKPSQSETRSEGDETTEPGDGQVGSGIESIPEDTEEVVESASEVLEGVDRTAEMPSANDSQWGSVDESDDLSVPWVVLPD